MTWAWGVRTILANTNLTFGLPLSIWLLKGFYDNSPVELKQAARIDGCTRFQALWMIVMPLSMHRGLGPARVGVEINAERARPHLKPEDAGFFD